MSHFGTESLPDLPAKNWTDLKERKKLNDQLTQQQAEILRLQRLLEEKSTVDEAGTVARARINTRLQEQMGRAIEAQQEVLEEQDKEILTDKLTGLGNRERLERAYKELEKARAQAAARGETFNTSVLVLDFDHMRDLNTALGHNEVDKLLQQIGATMNQNLRHDREETETYPARKGDISARNPEEYVNTNVGARVGGDEFVVLLPHTPMDGALVVAERLREEIGKISIPQELQDKAHSAGHRNLRVSMSVGVSTLRSGVEKIEDLKQEADIAAYHSKANGRNRVTVFEPGMTLPPAAQRV